MAELKKIKLSQIDPNPFRDIDKYPIDKVKIELLRQSMERTGFWEGYLLVRAVPQPSKLKRQRYEQPFGHHRVHAARELWGDDAEITVTVANLDDEMMLQLMANENSERYAQYFYLAVMEPIEATVKAYAEGRIQLEKPPENRKSQWRSAPGFATTGESGSGPFYTAMGVASYLGWTRPDSRNDSGQPSDRVLTALAALELIERKILTRKDFLTLTTTQAKTLVDVTRARMRAETAQIDATVSVKTQALKKAEKEGDTNKVNSLKASIDDIVSKADKQAKRAAKAAARSVVEDFQPKDTAEVVVNAAPETVPTKHVKTATQVLYDLIAQWERICLDTDPKLEKTTFASQRAKDAAVVALRALGQRANNRADEFEGGK